MEARSLTDALASARKQRIALARKSFPAFVEYTMVDEETAAPVVCAPHHVEWSRLLASHPRLMIWSFVESGKTQVISVAYVLWVLGKDPTLRVAILRNGDEQAREVIRLLARHIEHNDRLHEVFPAMKKAAPWNESQVTIERPGFAKDASVHGYGIGTGVVGARVDLLVCDDVVDNSNSMSPTPREQLANRFFREFNSRLTERGRLVVIGTPWHKDDLYHRLIALGMPCFKFPILDDKGASRWPQRWSIERIAQRRREIPSAEAARSLDCEIIDPATCVFTEDMLAGAITRGERSTSLTSTTRGWALINRGWLPAVKVCVGVDLAISQKASADESAIAVVFGHADGSRELAALEAGRWGANEIIARIVDVAVRFGPDSIVIESVAMQRFVADILNQRGDLNIVPYITNGRELSLANRVGEMEVDLANRRWMFPSIGGALRDRETERLVKDMRFYSRADHVPDRLVATMLGAWGLMQSEKNRAEVGRVDWMRR